MSVSTVIFPRMARQFGLGQIGELRQTLVAAVNPLMLVTLLAVVVLVTMRQSLVQVSLQYGNFDAGSASMVAEALVWFSFGLSGRTLIEPFTRAFYAMQDTRTPLVTSSIAVVVNIALSLVLLQAMGFAGIALGLSIASLVRMVALVVILSRRTGGFARDLGKSFLRMLPATVVAGGLDLVLASPVASLTDPVDGRTLWGYLAFGGALILIALTYMLVALAFRVPGAGMIVRRLLRRRSHPSPS